MSPRLVRSPHGSALTCKGWPQEAAYRMIQNNLDPEVAERPDDLVVYGRRGQAEVEDAVAGEPEGTGGEEVSEETDRDKMRSEE
ncbi:MAG: hypothetical protein HY784_01380 [Chloroflexi bacterium]|nr:hypothetical protein [Chloroflexota bacterium]